MRIGELSVKTGVSIRSLRYYEEKGLIAPNRLKNGYREYNESDLVKVEAIQLFLFLGLSTEEITSFIDCVPSISADCTTEAISLYEDKLKDTKKQIEFLKEVELKLINTLSVWRKIEHQSR